MKTDLSVARLRELLHYNPETGIFTWLVSTSNRIRVGRQAGTLNSQGYIQIGIDGVIYRANRLAWLYVQGSWPDGEVDHKNLVKTDNWFDNLRDATHVENNRNKRLYSNSTSGVSGVTFNKRQNKYRAHVKVLGKQLHLGYFEKFNDAVSARNEAEIIYFGEFRCSA